MWESRALREISKPRWTSFCEVHRRGISMAARRASAETPAVPRGRESSRLAIDASEFQVHEPDEPIAALGLGEAHEFTADGLAYKHVRPLPFDLSGLLHPSHLVARVIPRILEPRGVGPGRRRIHGRRRALAEGFMGAFRVEFAAHPIKPTLLRARRSGRRRRGVLLQGQVKAFVPSVLLRMPAIDPIELNAQFQPPHRDM